MNYLTLSKKRKSYQLPLYSHYSYTCPKFVNTHNVFIHNEDSIEEMVCSNTHSLNLLIIHFIVIFIWLNWLK